MTLPTVSRVVLKALLALREVDVQQEHYRDDGEAHQSQAPVEDQHRDDYPDQAEERAQKLRYTLGE